MPTHSICGRNKERGATLIEVLVTIVIVVVGLLGLAGLQARIQIAELESYQRAQAIVLLQDMVDRLSANRKESANYVTNSTGVGITGIANCGGMTNVWQKDLCEWGNSLAGAAETGSGGQALGAMLGARGCVFQTVAAMPREYVVAVVWQGLSGTAAPSTTCGLNQYGSEAQRRALTARVIIGCLQNTSTGACVTP